MTTLHQAMADLIPAPRPILFLDTCTLLDDLLMAADTLDRDHAGMSWAIDRVAAKQKPSSAKGYAISLEAAVADLRAAGEIPP